MNRTAASVVVCSMIAGFLGGMLSHALLTGMPLFAASPPVPRLPSVSKAEEFRLMDREGRSRAILGFSSADQPYLALLDEQETRRIWLGLSEESGLAIRDFDGKTRLILSLDTQGEPSLAFRDREDNSRLLGP